MREFKKLNDGQDPGLVVFASNFWDIASYSTKNASILASDDFDDYVMQEFEGNLSHALSTVEVGWRPDLQDGPLFYVGGDMPSKGRVILSQG